MAPPPIECPFDIPSPFKWNDSFKVFYDKLDKEHQGLFDVTLVLDEKKNDKGAYTKAAKAFKDHFVSEEGDMDAAVKCGSLGQDHVTHHKTVHQKFLDLFGSFASIGDDEIQYSMKWLVNHIKGTDFQYKKKLTPC